MSGGTRPVHPALRECLAGPMVAYDVAPPPDSAHLGLPSPTATVIVAVDDPLDVGWLAEPDRSTRHWTSISGLHLRPALIRTHGVQRGIQLAVTPTGCRALFGLPIGAVASDTVDLADVPRGLTRADHERLVAAPTWARRLALLEGMLLRRLGPARPDAEFGEAWRLVTSGVGVGAAAERLGRSRRHLLTRFRAEAGMGPKQVGRLARFDRARGLIRDGSPLGDAAYEAGFSDQAHLSREFAELAGRPPTAAREEFPNLHDIL